MNDIFANLNIDKYIPPVVDIKIADDIFVKQMVFAKAGTLMLQHKHTFDHLSMLATGSVRVIIEDKVIGEYHAPCGIMIKAGDNHVFETLTDNVIIYCIHNIARTGEIQVEDVHA